MCLTQTRKIKGRKSLIAYKIFVKPIGSIMFGSLVFDDDKYKLGETYVALDNSDAHSRQGWNRTLLKYGPRFHAYIYLKNAKEVMGRISCLRNYMYTIITICKVRIAKDLISGRSNVLWDDYPSVAGKEMTILKEIE